MVGASAEEDAEAAERSPLQLPESLIPEQVSIAIICKEQRNDPFSIDLLSQLGKLPDGEEATQADGRTKSSRALRLSKFAALDGVLFRVTEASDPKEGYDSARCYVPVRARCEFASSTHSGKKGRTRIRVRVRVRELELELELDFGKSHELELARTRTRKTRGEMLVNSLASSRVELTKSAQRARRNRCFLAQF